MLCTLAYLNVHLAHLPSAFLFDPLLGLVHFHVEALVLDPQIRVFLRLQEGGLV